MIAKSNPTAEPAISKRIPLLMTIQERLNERDGSDLKKSLLIFGTSILTAAGLSFFAGHGDSNVAEIARNLDMSIMGVGGLAAGVLSAPAIHRIRDAMHEHGLLPTDIPPLCSDCSRKSAENIAAQSRQPL